MIKIHFLTGIRKLLKDRFYSVINVSGLAIGLATCLLIIFYIQEELSYDRFHEKSGQIYRICALGSIGNTPINQAAAKLFESAGAMGKKIHFGGYEFHVIGVMQDFHYESFHQTIRAANANPVDSLRYE
jgi:hypothetical protein